LGAWELGSLGAWELGSLGAWELESLRTWELGNLPYIFGAMQNNFPFLLIFFLFVPVYFLFYLRLIQHLKISYYLLVLIFLSSSFSFLILGTW
jgi:hypothetical protein